jgi:hypothetical protein
VKVTLLFGGTCSLHLQGEEQAKEETSKKQAAIRAQYIMAQTGAY